MTRRLTKIVCAALGGVLVVGCSSGARPAPLVHSALRVDPSAAPTTSWTFAQSHGHDTLPADEVAPSSDPCASAPLPAAWLAQENKHAGDPAWQPNPPAKGVELYLSDPSVTCGDTLEVHLGGAGAPGVHVVVDRIGWYGGAGARQVWYSPAVNVRHNSEPSQHDRVSPDAKWKQLVRVPVPQTWVPGLYVAEAEVKGVRVGASFFVVRRLASHAPLVVVDSNLTWGAYNSADGASLYLGPFLRGYTHAIRFAHRSHTVSMLRPSIHTGLSQPLIVDVPLAEMTDRLGVPTDHVLDSDLEIRPSVVTGHAGLVIPGHAEYWTRRAYETVRVERDLGMNLLDFGGNTIYWHARLTHDAHGAPRDLTVYKDAAADPRTAKHPEDSTVKWVDPQLGMPQAAVLGEAFSTVGANGGLVVHNPPAWLVAGTAARDGVTLPGSVQNEADGARGGDPAAPPNVQVVTEGVLRGITLNFVSSSYYSDPSGAGVYDVGVTYWLCAAMGLCPNPTVSADTQAIMYGMSANLIREFALPRWGATHPSHLDVPASAAAVLPTLPTAAVGVFGNEHEGNGSALPKRTLGRSPSPTPTR